MFSPAINSKTSVIMIYKDEQDIVIHCASSVDDNVIVHFYVFSFLRVLYFYDLKSIIVLNIIGF